VDLFVGADRGLRRRTFQEPILGSYFPSWMVCAPVGIVLALVAGGVLEATGLFQELPAPLAVLLVFGCAADLVFANRIQLGHSIAVCLIALGYCATSLADDAAAVARPGSLSQERLNSAAQNGTDFALTHGNYAQARYHPADRINTQTIKDLELAWTFQVDVTESIQARRSFTTA
jgi:glucose dehydrogenase